MIATDIDNLEGFELDLGLGADPITPTLVRYWCEAFEDSNPRYWAADDGMIAPPALMTAVSRLAFWPADESVDPRGVIGVVGDALGRAESVVQSVDFTFERDLRIGDQVRCVERVLSISPEKTTRLGAGNFVKMERRYLDASGETIGFGAFDFFKYSRAGVAAPVTDSATVVPNRSTPADRGGILAPSRQSAAGLNDGDLLTPLVWNLNGTRMVQMGYICRDFNPVHHDPTYARGNGVRDIFVQWACQIGIIDRYVARELGADGRIRRMKFRMLRSTYAWIDLKVTGTVLRREGDLIVLDVQFADDQGATTEATVWAGA